MITIIDHGTGNVSAIGNIFKKSKIDFRISNQIQDIKNSDKYVLPGVGSFDTTMQNLSNLNILETLKKEVLEKEKHILGICVGMQIFSNKSQEGSLDGLGWIPGEVKKFDKCELKELNLYLPHMGWNSLRANTKSHPLLGNINFEKGFYFLHSYFFCPRYEDHNLASTNYGKIFSCIISKNNIHGVQFHPEKSHNNGIQLLKNFANL